MDDNEDEGDIDLDHISRTLHGAMNDIIGSDQLVHIRRTTTNICDDVLKVDNELINSGYLPRYSGSKAEGLRFESSDDDWMFVNRDIRIIPSDSYSPLYDCNTVLLLLDNQMTKPGFTLLRVVDVPNEYSPRLSLHLLNENWRYLSSKKWRESHTEKHMNTAFTHGPCTSIDNGGNEMDFAYCLKCDFWPAIAQSSIQRLYQRSWPSYNTLLSIVNDGVLFVAIGAKKSVFEDNEWRMSFSLAEKRLIQSMNHTQFLCYGLLKVFLKEAIDANKEVKGLLCSYFLKTALFWEITHSSNEWNPSSMLSCFWNCFRRLLQWVNCSYCPNFFIPENNMFGGKIGERGEEKSNRDKLLKHLTTLYNEGIECLLRCSSFTDRHVSRIFDRHPDTSNNVLSRRSVASIAITIITEVHYSLQQTSLSGVDKKQLCIKLHHLMLSADDCLERFITKHWLHFCLTKLCISRESATTTSEADNKSNYKSHMQKMKALKQCRTDSVCHCLYQAMVCYNFEIYNQSLKLIELAKEAIFSENSMYFVNMSKTKFREEGYADHPVANVMRRSLIDNVHVLNHESIPEFFIESQDVFGFQTSITYLSYPVPPLISALFLQYLCYNRLGHQDKCNEALDELFCRIKYYDGLHFAQQSLPISWQILGICQQIHGNDEAACRSYLRALRYEWNLQKDTTCIRLLTVLAKYFWITTTD